MSATKELLQEGRYRINQEFPQVGKGSVYEAYDTVRDTTVVVKEIPVTLNKVTTVSQQELLRLAFANQAKILTEIDHDSLLHVHDYFSEVGRQYLVMESVDGDDMRELLERNDSAFAVSDVLAWADNLLDALNYLHTYKPPIIHRNIRPENVKLTSSGKLKLLAFGLADGSDTRVNTTIAADSAEQAVINYSPLELIWEGLDSASQKVITNSYDERSERILKEPADARSDIYAMGATLYHLITGQRPIDALERSIEILDGKADPLSPPNKIDPNIPVDISDFLLKAMEIKRENRYDSAAIMRQVLRTVQIRVKEREEEEEALEQREAAEYLREAEEKKIEEARVAAEQLRLEMEAEQKREAEAARLVAEQLAAEAEHERQTELLKEQLRDAEAQRILVEQRAAEAEEERQAQLLKEQERVVETQRLLEEQKTVEAETLLAKQRAAEEERLLAEKRAAEVEEERQAQLIKEREREAEAQRLLDEQRAAEAEALLAKQRAVEEEKLLAEQRVAEVQKRILEQEAAKANKTKSSESAVSEDSLVDILAAAEAVPQSVESGSASLLEALEELDIVVVEPAESVRPAELETAKSEAAVSASGASAVKSTSGYESKSYDEDMPGMPLSTGSSLPIPAIAIGAIALIIVAAAVWMFMPSGSSDSSTPTQSQSTSVNTSELPTGGPSPAASDSASSEVPADSTDTATLPGDPTKAAPLKGKKPTPTPATAKAPAPTKKPVTVDDLINDN